jgi:hypothetical protein
VYILLEFKILLFAARSFHGNVYCGLIDCCGLLVWSFLWFILKLLFEGVKIISVKKVPYPFIKGVKGANYGFNAGNP